MFFSHTPPVRQTNMKQLETEEANRENESEKYEKNLEEEECTIVEQTKIRDDGVTDVVWNELQAAKEEAMRREREREENRLDLA
jgi:hypothetical protein